MRKTFTVEGNPSPFQRTGKGFYTQGRHKQWAKQVAVEVMMQNRGQKQADPKAPFVLVVTTHPGTRKDGKPKVVRGDVDNYAKLVADCLQGILYENDKQSWGIFGAEGESWPNQHGGQTIVIVWPMSRPIVSDALQAFLTAIDPGGYCHES